MTGVQTCALPISLLEVPLVAVTNEKYSLIGVDMRDSLTLNTLLQTVKVDETKPTLLLSEVVLTYMGRSSCNRLIQWILDFFQECILCTYEQVLPDDGFGQVMVAHFAKLGSPLKCIHQYPTGDSQVQRYTHLVRLRRVRMRWQDTLDASRASICRSA